MWLGQRFEVAALYPLEKGRERAMRADLGLIGLGVMGRNLSLNLAHHGFTVAVYDRSSDRVGQLLQEPADGRAEIVGTGSLPELVAALKRPRKILLLIPAGPGVDQVIAALLSYLEPGDIVIDGGNSHYKETNRRGRMLEAMGLSYLGVGISGGAEGALRGPSLMVGGSRRAWELTRDLFMKIAARVEATPCCAYVGPEGAGHFVKMVHNGIEYGDMQLIGEVYLLLRELLGFSAAETGAVFREWNNGELGSYLLEISADILNKKDAATGNPIVEVIADRADQKGTGQWAAQAAFELGVSVPTINAAVGARFLSALKEERIKASEELTWVAPRYEGDPAELLPAARAALYAARICTYAQGFALLKAAAAAYRWELDGGTIAQLWRGGCIIRAKLLTGVKEAFAGEPELPNLLMAPYFKKEIEAAQSGWRRIVGLAAQQGIPVPAISSALAYFDSYRRSFLPANLVQAQRDYFGAHGYERLDRPGTFHTDWQTKEETVHSKPLQR